MYSPGPSPAAGAEAAAPRAATAVPSRTIIQGDNNVPGIQGFACGPGYSLATDLGSLDATALVDAWPQGR